VVPVCTVSSLTVRLNCMCVFFLYFKQVRYYFYKVITVEYLKKQFMKDKTQIFLQILLNYKKSQCVGTYGIPALRKWRMED
jgi:hypothetical protein